jgi:hypothetical protein
MSKLQVIFGQNADGGVVFVNDKGKAETFNYEHPLEQDKALAALKSEVNGRHNVTRASLTMLVQMLARDRVSGYKGKGDLAASGGIPSEAKSALRDAETEHFKPMFAKVEQMDTFLAAMREGGPYAVAKGVALKYFYYMGKLPCAYNDDGTPDTNRLLPLNAMQKIMRNATPDTDPKTYGDKVDEIRQAFDKDCEEKKERVLDINMVSGLVARAKQLLESAEQWRNVLNAAATAGQNAMMKAQANPAPAPAQVKADDKPTTKASKAKPKEHATASK